MIKIARMIGLILIFGHTIQAAKQEPLNIDPKLTQAIETNNIEVISTALDNGFNVNTRDARGETLLMFAAMFCNVKIVQLLLDCGANIDAHDDNGQTAIFYPLRNPNESDCFETLTILFDHGAEAAYSNKYGQTPLDIVYNSSSKIVQLLLEHGAPIDKNLFSRVANSGNIPVAELLLRYRQNINPSCQDITEETPLSEAARGAQVKMVQFLLEHGANIDGRCSSKNRSGRVLDNWTALMNAASCSYNTEEDNPNRHIEYLNTVNILLQAGANMNLQDDHGMTAVMLAIDATCHGAGGKQPILGSIEGIIQALINHGANLNLQDNDGMTALMLATAQSKNKTIAAMLIQAGADITIINHDGKTAMDLTPDENFKAYLLDISQKYALSKKQSNTQPKKKNRKKIEKKPLLQTS